MARALRRMTQRSVQILDIAVVVLIFTALT